VTAVDADETDVVPSSIYAAEEAAAVVVPFDSFAALMTDTCLTAEHPTRKKPEAEDHFEPA